jgi:hypothetical protein
VETHRGCAKARHWRAFLTFAGKVPWTRDWLAGAGGIEPCYNPLTHKDFSLPARLVDSIFDSKAQAATLSSLQTAIAGG